MTTAAHAAVESIARDARVRSLCARLHDDRASLDEIIVIDEEWSRIEKGRDHYGAMTLATDPREWTQEQCEELLDYLVYRRVAAVVRQNEQRQRLRCEAADELAAAAAPIDTRLKAALVELRNSALAPFSCAALELEVER